MQYEELSSEQQQFIQYAIEGHNILVDACIGSGKTMAIQTLCTYAQSKRILYLTYNKLLKLDAQDRIQNGMVTVTNYHGFCYRELANINVRTGIFELIQTYNRIKPKCTKYDVLILDEYQDIEEEIAEVLEHIKSCCPNIQIIAVGDMEQKIYDKTRLDVQAFITDFLGNYIPMEFTTCFRIGAEHAAMLGRIWNKSIVGVNNDFKIMELWDYAIEEYAASLEPRQLLVLGSKGGKACELQNALEEDYPDKFNKHTLWSKIKETDGSTSPTPDCAIFTTYDGCKGMEREVCVLYDWCVPYWQSRLEKPDTRYEILRNIFCVAASRGKKLLIIAKTDMPLDEETLTEEMDVWKDYADMPISEMFDYKFVEDVEAAYQCLDINEIQPDGEEIQVPNNDGLVDLSPCIGHYQECMFFHNYDIDSALEYYLRQYDKSYMRRSYKKYTLDQKLLYLATLETKQLRYMNQVKSLPISSQNRKRIAERLSTHFDREEAVQDGCGIEFWENGRLRFSVTGLADVVKDNIVYELKFVSALSHVHVLQLAMYLACMGYAVGRLWNVRNNQMLEIRIPDRQEFLDKVVTAITKGSITTYETNTEKACELFLLRHRDVCLEFLLAAKEKKRCSSAWVIEWFAERGLQPPVSGSTIGKYIIKQSKRLV